MTKARLTTCPDAPKANPLTGVEEQVRAFFASGKKVQEIPFGVQAETHQSVSRKAMNERTARQLGGKRGSETKKENFKRSQQKYKGPKL